MGVQTTLVAHSRYCYIKQQVRKAMGLGAGNTADMEDAVGLSDDVFNGRNLAPE
jgi:hypothetical protein